MPNRPSRRVASNPPPLRGRPSTRPLANAKRFREQPHQRATPPATTPQRPADDELTIIQQPPSPKTVRRKSRGPAQIPPPLRGRPSTHAMADASRLPTPPYRRPAPPSKPQQLEKKSIDPGPITPVRKNPLNPVWAIAGISILLLILLLIL